MTSGGVPQGSHRGPLKIQLHARFIDFLLCFFFLSEANMPLCKYWVSFSYTLLLYVGSDSYPTNTGLKYQ